MYGRIEKIIIYFKNTEKQLSMHIMNNMCDECNKLNCLIKDKEDYPDYIEEFQMTIQ